MPTTTSAERTLLRLLLESGALAPRELRAVRDLYGGLSDGRLGGLNDEQRTWMEQLCRRCGVAIGIPGPNRKRPGQEAREKLLAQFDAMPRPKKPPGRM